MIVSQRNPSRKTTGLAAELADSFKAIAPFGRDLARSMQQPLKAGFRGMRRLRRKSMTAAEFASYLSSYPLGFGFSGENQDIMHSKAGAAAAYRLVPEVNNSISSIVGGVESLPWDIKRYPSGKRRENGQQVEGEILASNDDLQTNHPMHQALRRFQRANNFSLIGTMALDYTLYGEVVLEIARNDYWSNEIIEWLNPLGVQVFAQSRVEQFRYGWNTTFATLYPDEVAYLHNRNPQDDFTGYPQVLAVLDKVNVARNLDRFLRDYFINSARPSLVVMPPSADDNMSDKDHAGIVAQFRESLKGAGSQYGTFVAQKALNVIPLEQPDLSKNNELSESQSNAIYEKFSVPRAMRGNTSATPYKDGDETTRRFYLDAVIPLAKILQQFINAEVMPYFDMTSGLEVFEFDTSAFDMVTAADQLEAQIIDMQVRSGLIDLYTAAQKQELPVDKKLRGMYLVEGVPVPVDDLKDYWKKHLLIAPSVYNSEELTGKPLPAPSQPGAVVPTESGGEPVADDAVREELAEDGEIGAAVPRNETETQKDGVQEACVLLKLASSPDLLALRKRVEEYLGDVPVQWNLPDTYHVTLAFIPGITDEQLEVLKSGLEAMTLPDLKLNIGSLDSFQDFDQYAVHFRIRKNPALTDLQRKIVDLCNDAEIELSIYSDPANYVPHITLGYAGEKPGRMTYHSKVMVAVESLQLTNEHYDVLLEVNEQGSRTPTKSHQHTHEPASWQAKLYDGDPDETEIQQRIDAELKTYRSFELRHYGKAHRDFVPSTLPPYIHHALIDAVDTAKNKDDIDTIFAGVLELPRVKSISSYQRSIREYGTGLWNGVLEPESVTSGIQDLISREYEAAFYAGVERGGLDRGDLEEDELGELVDLIESERGHVPGLVSWILDHSKRRGGRMASIRGRVDQWVSRYASVEQVGYLIASRDKKIKWSFNPRKEHCVDCRKLNGRVYRGRVWRKANIYTQSSLLACFGLFCGCSQDETDEPITPGSPPRLVGPR